jgi:hypothetical protein
MRLAAIRRVSPLTLGADEFIVGNSQPGRRKSSHDCRAIALTGTIIPS